MWLGGTLEEESLHVAQRVSNAIQVESARAIVRRWGLAEGGGDGLGECGWEDVGGEDWSGDGEWEEVEEVDEVDESMA